LNESSLLRTIIVDDEQHARDNVRLALASDPDVEVVAECRDGQEAVDAIRALSPDLVFLDVQMPTRSGFGVIEEIGVEEMPTTVFVTAFDSHALHAFEVRAIDYLLKPFDDGRLHEALRRAKVRRVRREDDLPERLAELLAAFRPAAGPGETPARITRFMVREDDCAVPIRAQDVDWIEADGNYVRLHVGKSSHRIRVTLKSLVHRLDPQRFARVHKSAIVNLDRIQEVQPWFAGDYIAILHGGHQVRVSRTFAHLVLRTIQ
jgi:two-component system, LytTR family, response regulator